MATKTEAFSKLGAKLVSPKWSWSARTNDAVVLRLWSDKFDWKAKPVSYDGSHEPGDEQARGNKERLGNLLWARDHCDGRIKVVMVKCVEPINEHRKVQECFARSDLEMRITELNEENGEFQAQILGRTKT